MRSPRPALVPRAILAVVVLAAACGRGTSQGTSDPVPPSSTRSPASSPLRTDSAMRSPDQSMSTLALAGTLYFGRFDLGLEGMTVWVSNADGTGARLFVPGSRLVSCVLPGSGQVVMTAASDDRRIVPSVADADGSNFRELTVPDDTLNLGVAACAPDGKTITAEGWDDTDPARTGLYSLSIDGAELRRLTRAGRESHDIPGCYVADGVAYLRYRGDEPGTLHIVASDGSATRQVGNGDYGTGPACSPDGQTLLVEADGSLYLVNTADGSRTELTSAADGFASAHKYGPWFAGDGDVVLFAMKLPGPYHDLYAMHIDGTGLTRLTFHPQADNESPRLVPAP